MAMAHGRYEGNETTFVVQMFGLPAEAPGAVVTSTEPESAAGTGVPAGRQVSGAAAEAQPLGAIKDGRTSTVWRFLTSPKTSLQYIYMGIAALILFAVGLLFLVELRRLHVPSFIRGVGLLALIVFLLYGSTAFSGNLLIL